MSAPLKNREAIEAAITILRGDMLPPRHARAPIVKTLEAMALALAMGDREERVNLVHPLSNRVEA